MLCETRPFKKLDHKVDFVERIYGLVQLHDEPSLVAHTFALFDFPQYFYFSSKILLELQVEHLESLVDFDRN